METREPRLCSKRYFGMTRWASELSTLAILGIATAFALTGLLAYVLIMPLSPADRVALGHAAVSETVIR